MSAAFSIGEDDFNGTNGAIEAYVESLAGFAESRVGRDSPIARYFRSEREGFFPGKTVELDEWLGTPSERDLFVKLLDAATEQLLNNDTFSEYGRNWVATTMASLRVKILSMNSSTSPSP